MPIKKRKLPQRRKPIKLSPAQKRLAEKRAYFRELAIGLQHNDTFFRASSQIAIEAGLDCISADATCLDLAAKFECKSITSFWGDEVSHTVTLLWTDKRKPPINGHYYPRMIAVKSSPYMNVSYMLAYIEICIQAGEYV